MPRNLRFDLPGGVYHVTARGNEKKPIFRDDADRHAYLERLVACRKRFGFRLYAFCLMSNHVHLAVERSEVAVSKIVLALHSAYAQRFNRRHGRVGHLFQGRYKAFLVEKDVYLLTLIRYIHLNPVKAGLVTRPEAYRWSSDRHYRSAQRPAWMDREPVLAMLGVRRALVAPAYRQLMASDAATYEEAAVTAAAIKGTPAFTEVALRSVDRTPARAELEKGWTIERVAAAAASSAGLTLDQLRAPGQSLRPARERAVAAYVGWRHGGIPLARSARFFGRHDSTFVHAARRVEAAAAIGGWSADRIKTVLSLLTSSGVQG